MILNVSYRKLSLGKFTVGEHKGYIHYIGLPGKNNILKLVQFAKKWDFIISIKREINAYNKKTLNEIDEYLYDKRKNFTVKYKMLGTTFQKKVWEETLKIKYGETLSYGEVSDKIGIYKGARAIGNALSVNPLPILIPCHRVIGKKGKLIGFGGGIDMKQLLLNIEKERN
ncbi:cysteine methyltransferase [candidate division TA06 bacterium]|uniref:methylated-DNA--[protein]-cysteine S-methyltransferase n=1 Tax=candidate division TA06 bacterium TaxID=2250710 RepID=A0A660SDU2_UNCT6|nr:MAG: cysteine methyltransferase [candidate division TA06 bacterium]